MPCAGGGSGFFFLARVPLPSDIHNGFDKKELAVVIAAPPHLSGRTTLADGGKLRVFMSESELDVEAL